MSGLAIFVQRRRKIVVRLAALTVLGLGGLLAVLPRADANDLAVRPVDFKVLLLSPKPVSGSQFATFYPVLHR